MAIVSTPDTWPINSQTKDRLDLVQRCKFEIAVSPDL
jgi:hypothetical protein